MKRKIAIFGGTFDPWTAAHQWIVNSIIDNDYADVVIISPTIVDWHRSDKRPWLSDKEKEDVIVSALESVGWIRHEYDHFHENEVKEGVQEFFRTCDSKKIVLSTRDFIKRNMLRTTDLKQDQTNDIIVNHRFIHTLIDLKMTFGVKNDWSVVLGTDSIKSFRSWYMPNDIISNASIIGVDGRDADELDHTKYDFVRLWLKTPEIFAGTSASKIRDRYQSIEDGVHRYISDTICRHK